jgi:uncharacterized protein DUF4336
MTGYEPLGTLKQVARDIWLIDGPAIRFYGMPFSTRATIIRLKSGELWVHSPTRLGDALRREVADLGPVRHLVAPNWIHYAYVGEWQTAFPKAISWAAPGVKERAAKHGMAMRFDHDLGTEAEAPWRGQVEQLIVEGSRVHREAVFFHIASKTLILTDLIENFEPVKLAWWMRPLARLAGIADPDGQMPRDMRATFRKHRDQLRTGVEQMIGWGPERIILAHGRWYETGGVDELKRAFRFVL